MQPLDWDSLRFVLAVVDCGSAKAAAAALGVNHTTVMRRIAAMEKRYEIKLFDRSATGFSPTPTCRAVVEISRSMSSSVLQIEQEVLGRHARLSGHVVLTTTDTIYFCGLDRLLDEFQERHPAITIETHVTNARLDLSRYVADIAVRPSLAPPAHLTGRRVSGLAFAVYGARRWHTETDDPVAAHQRWIGLGEALAGSPVQAWLKEKIPNDWIVLRADSFATAAAMLTRGRCVAVLPCCLGDIDPALRRIGPMRREMDTFIWVLTNQGRQAPVRVRALTDFLARALKGRSAQMEGRASS